MKPACYFDLCPAPPAPQEEGRSGRATSTIARLLRILHGTMRQRGVTLPIALPLMRMGESPHPGNVLRVFGASAEELMHVASELERSPFVRDYVVIGRTRPVPPGVKRFIEYRRFRIPNRKSRTQEVRQRRLLAGDQLPFIRMTSESNAQAFSLRVCAIEHAAPSDECLPDSYGLSLSSRPFALPDLPV